MVVKAITGANRFSAGCKTGRLANSYDVRYWQSRHQPERNSVANDPDVWSGRALQESSSGWRWTVLHQCIRPLIGAFGLRAIMDISARAISLADRPQRAIRVTSVRMRREDRTSISSRPLADLGG